MPEIPDIEARSELLVDKARSGDEQALRDLLELYRGRLKQLIRLRLSPELQGRIDDSDVLQDALVEFVRTIEDYKRDPKLPLYLWLRQIVIRRLVDVHRRHLDAGRRDARREIDLARAKNLAADSASMAIQLSGRITTPLSAMLRDEMRAQVHSALNLMEPLDREIIALRHFEQLSNAESAVVLEIEASAASKRYTRALERLRKIMSKFSD